MIRSIGPVWDGNEVWLIAGGGTLFFAFPLLYASAFSGFYLPLMIVLWLLIMRGASIELRMHMENHVWRAFFDGLFFVSSALLAIFFGAALANAVRGVPLGDDNYFFLPLWTNWQVGPQPGILDWYTVIGGLVAFISLSIHGALYMVMKASGDLENSSRAFVRFLWPGLVIITIASLIGTIVARPRSLLNYESHAFLFLIPLVVLASLAGIRVFTQKLQPFNAFLSSCLYLVMMLVGAAAGLYPTVLPSSTDAARDMTIAKSLAGPHGLRVGLVWWGIGMLLALLYFVTTYRMFRGKVSDDSGYGH
jgi:cytochrome d ubiquinol oxidase subunit II